MSLVLSRVGLAPDVVDYARGLDMQKSLHEKVRAGDAPSTVLLLEHSPVYTAGRRTEDHERPLDGTPVIPVDRGGKLTWHGPGQLVGYPILALGDPTRVTAYVEALEEVILRTLDHLGIAGVRIDGRSGVWLDDGRGPARKIAAIGIRVKDRVTMHGFAVNCSNDLAPFRQIVPCGISDAGVTTVSEECGRTVTPRDIVALVETELRRLEALLVGRVDSDATDLGGAATEPARTAPAATTPTVVPIEGALL